jgi:hypothetical protein
LIEATIETTTTMDKTNNNNNNNNNNNSSTIDTVSANDNEVVIVVDYGKCSTDSTNRSTNNVVDNHQNEEELLNVPNAEITQIIDDNITSSVIQQQVMNKNGIDILLEAFENSVCFVDDAMECSFRRRDRKRINLEEQLRTTTTITVQESNNNNNNNSAITIKQSEVPNRTIHATASIAETRTTDIPFNVVEQSPSYHQRTKQQQQAISNQPTKPQISWWQKSAIRKAVTFLEEDLEQVVSNSDVIRGSNTFRTIRNTNWTITWTW